MAVIIVATTDTEVDIARRDIMDGDEFSPSHFIRCDIFQRLVFF